MIRRVFRGRSPYGLLSYLYGQGRRNEHMDPHLVASWDGDPAALEPGLDAARGMPAVGPLTRLLEQPVRGCDRLPEKWVYHLVLRNDPGDRRLSDDEWAQVCTAAMSRTGIAAEGDAAGCRWVAVRHADDHIHLVATLAREDGRAPRVWNDYARLAEVAHEFEDAFGLRSTAGRDDRTAAPRPGVKERATSEALGRTVAPRVVLRTRVKAAAAASTGFANFTCRLAEAGVTVWPRMSELLPEQVTGYSVSLDDWTNAAGEPVRFGGGKLAPDLSLPKLRARWGEPPSAGASTARRAATQTHGPAAPRLTGPEAERAWRNAERIVRQAATRMTADARSNPDAAADAAWAASDALAAAAAGLEGDRGGPLTDATEAFERAGRDCYRRIPERSDTGAALRTAARTIAVLSAGNSHPAGRSAMLTVALTSLVVAVGDLREAQQRLHQAEAARAAAARLQLAAATSPATAGPDLSRPRTAAQQAALAFTMPPGAIRPAAARPGHREDPVDRGRTVGRDGGRGQNAQALPVASGGSDGAFRRLA